MRKFSMVLSSYSPKIWQHLNGVFCVYKPAGEAVQVTRHKLITNICEELNQLKCRPPKQILRIERDETGNGFEVLKEESFADNVLVVGPRYQLKDVRLSWTANLGKQVSGVFLFGLGNGGKLCMKIRNSQAVRAYKVRGKFGTATHNYFRDGRIIEKATFSFIRQYHIDRLLSSIEAAHQKKTYELCGLEIQSQKTYDLFSHGDLARPRFQKDVPVIFNIKCTEFDLPYFTMEIHAVNEYETYLMCLVHEIALKLKSVAFCESIQCIRYGHFTVDHALLPKHWRLQPIIDNLAVCAKIVNENSDHLLRHKETVLV